MDNKSDAPRIAVSWIVPGQEKSERYLRAVAAGGAEPVALPADARSWETDLETVRGLVLTGGGDVDPRLYGEQNVGLSTGINRQRDDLETATLRFCLDRGLPVLAICRGPQLANVAMGGSLIQDIQTEIRHRPRGEESSFHEIEVRPGTRLAGLLGGRRKLRVNSRHHQGADLGRVASQLRVSALAADGIVEGLELDGDGFLMAVQCHPEYLDDVPELTGLFAELVVERSISGSN